MKHILIRVVLFLFCLHINAQENTAVINKAVDAIPSENYQSITFNGIWSWFSDPRAVYHEGKYKRTYAGWIDNYGDVHVGYYDHQTKTITSKVIYDNLEIDDHDNPSILIGADGRLLVFFNTHLQDERPLFMRASTNPEEIDSWEPIQELYLNNEDKYRKARILKHTYTNPIKLSAEGDKIYLFWRGVDLKPSYSISTDYGKTWSEGELLFIPKELEDIKSPYTKVYSDGVSKIHFTFTDGHPTKEQNNGLYYMYYEQGAFYKANGDKIKEVSQLPVLQSELDVIFKSDTVKSWNWDIAQDEKGNPIVTYVKFPDSKTHTYTYAIFSDNEWKSYELVNAGGWFPKTRQGKEEPEPHYSGGISIDHENPTTIYVSVKRDNVFEIEQWTTNNQGKSWTIEPITKGSVKDNVRPFAVRGAKPGNPFQVLWLQNTNYIYYAHDTRGKTSPIDFKERYHSSIKMNLPKPSIKPALTTNTLKVFLRSVIEGLLENAINTMSLSAWQEGIIYEGIEAFYEISKEARYKNELKNIKQYQFNTNDNDDKEDDNFEILDVIWSERVKNNREAFEKIESLSIDNIQYYKAGFQSATMLYAIRNLSEHILAAEQLKNDYIKISTKAAEQLQVKTAKDQITDDKVLLLYSLASAINDGLLDKKYTNKVLNAWETLQNEMVKNRTLFSSRTELNGSVLLAGKEIYKLLETKKNN